MSKFNFKIEHVKGRENIIPDILSRQPDYQTNSDEAAILIKSNDGTLKYNKKEEENISATIEIKENNDLKKRIINLTEKNKIL